MSSRTRSRNAFETQLNGAINNSATSFNVISATGLTAPVILCIDPENPTKREFIDVLGISTNTFTSVTRGLAGSVGGTGQAHDDGATVRAVPVHQHLDKIFDDIEALETADAGHFGGTDTSDHPEATGSIRGFMAAADKAKLDGIDSGAQADHPGLTGVTADQHHARDHTVTGATHSATGLTNGQVLKATGASSFTWATLDHAQLSSVSANQHHNESHTSRHSAGGADQLQGIANGGYFPGTHLYLTSSGSFTKASHPGLRAVRVRVQAGGGGGGGAAITGASESSVGHGGGAGGYSESFILAASLATSETVTVGTGGGANSGAAGGAGANSSFGTFAVANGGGGGDFIAAGSTAASDNNNGAGAAAGTGDFAIGGGAGGLAVRQATVGSSESGFGGVAHLGQSPGARGSQADGIDGKIYGAGGSGAKNGANQGSARPGGAGAAGIVIVELYF